MDELSTVGPRGVRITGVELGGRTLSGGSEQRAPQMVDMETKLCLLSEASLKVKGRPLERLSDTTPETNL